MINYDILSRSISYYEEKKFQRIELPWTVTKSISDITRPEGGGDFTIKEKNKVLVASGEQSFLYLINKGFLPYGTYQGITPCFRDEPFDGMHSKYFLKNELIYFFDENTLRGLEVDTIQVNLDWMLYVAKGFFNSLGIQAEEKQTGQYSYDLMYKDDELGSYGYRKCDFCSWIYGTGVAENRTSRILLKYGLPLKKN